MITIWPEPDIAANERELVARATGGDVDAFYALTDRHDRGLRVWGIKNSITPLTWDFSSPSLLSGGSDCRHAPSYRGLVGSLRIDQGQSPKASIRDRLFPAGSGQVAVLRLR